jgi:hypothetical protein
MIFVVFLLFFSVLNISTVAADVTTRSVSYFDAHPYVQGQNSFVNIICVLADDMDINEIKVVVTFPNGAKTENAMLWSSDGKYVYKDTYRVVGSYTFYIVFEDMVGNKYMTMSKNFWITTNLDDVDSDGMPDWWEEKYDFNPEYPIDAYDDADDDGYTNKEEYEIGTNPLKVIFIQNAAYRVRENGLYLGVSIFLFLVMVLLSFYGKRRFF